MRWSNEASANGSDSADACDELDAAVEAGLRGGEHVRALIEPRDAMPAGAGAASATRPVPVATSSTCPPSAGMRETRNAPPAWVLAEREDGADPVVARAERREQRERVAAARRSPSLYPGTVELVERPRAHRGGRGGACANGDDGRGGPRRRAGRRRPRATSAPSRRRRRPHAGSCSTTTATPVTGRRDVHDAASIAALCELAEECRVPGRPRRAARAARGAADGRAAGRDRRGRGRCAGAPARARRAAAASPRRRGWTASASPRAGSSARSTPPRRRRSRRRCSRRRRRSRSSSTDVEGGYRLPLDETAR